MLYSEFISALESSLRNQPMVRSVVRDMWEVDQGKEQGTVFYRVDSFVTDKNGYARVGLVLLYLDVLGVDCVRLSSGVPKEFQIYSDGVNVLHNALHGFHPSSVRYAPFVHRFLDDCAGVFANVDLVLPYTLCKDSY